MAIAHDGSPTRIEPRAGWVMALGSGLLFLAGAVTVSVAISAPGKTSIGVLLIGLGLAVASGLLFSWLRSRVDPKVPWYASSFPPLYLWRHGHRAPAIVMAALDLIGAVAVLTALVTAIW